MPCTEAAKSVWSAPAPRDGHLLESLIASAPSIPDVQANGGAARPSIEVEKADGDVLRPDVAELQASEDHVAWGAPHDWESRGGLRRSEADLFARLRMGVRKGEGR